MAKSVAYPVVGLGVSTAALASGFDQAQAVAKAGMDKVASTVQSVSVRPLFDTSNITKGLEAALSKVEEFKKKSASIDMIGKLSASQNPFFAMAQSGPKGKGPAVDMIGQLGEWQADKAAKAKAQAVAKAGMDKVASAVQSVSVRPLFDTSNITKGLEAALSKVEEFKKKSSSIDMIGKLSASQNPFFAMAQSGPKGKGPAVDMIGQLGEWQADKAAKAKAQEEQAWQAQFNAKSQSIQAWLDKQNEIESRSKARWASIRSMWDTGSNALVASSRSAWSGISRGFDSFVRTVGNPLATLTRYSMPINQTLELAGKVNRVLGAPIRAAMAMEGGRADVAAGGKALLASDSLSGTMARFEIEVTRTFANIWNAIDQTFDIQGLMEYFRGMLAGVSVLIESVFGPVEEVKKDPKFLTEAFKQGALTVVDAFEGAAKFAISIKNAFLDILQMLSKIPGSSLIFGDLENFTPEQEELILNFQKEKRLVRKNMPFAEAEAIGPNLNGIGDRDLAIQILRQMGQLPGQIDDANAIEKMAQDMRDRIGKMGLAPEVLPEDARKATLAIDDFTRSLRSANDSLYALELAAVQDAERIAQMENQGADPLDVFLAQSAADLAQGARVLEFAARQMPRDTAISAASQGSQALADALGRAMSTTNGRDIQSEIKSAIEEQVRQQQETNRLQMEALQIWNRFKPGQQVQVRGMG